MSVNTVMITDSDETWSEENIFLHRDDYKNHILNRWATKFKVKIGTDLKTIVTILKVQILCTAEEIGFRDV